MCISDALVAQPDRASDYESEGRRFESCRARYCKWPVCSKYVLRPRSLYGLSPARCHNWYHNGARKRRFEVKACSDTYGGFESRAGSALGRNVLIVVKIDLSVLASERSYRIVLVGNLFLPDGFTSFAAIRVYSCDPKSPWQHAISENTKAGY